jgi:iron complex transport system substrate-binding protein
MKKLIFSILTLLSTLIYSNELEIVDSYGNEVKLETNSINRVISLAPNITEIVYAIGAESKLVGRTDYCNFPKEVKKIETVGEIFTPSFEKILSLKPDIVIASSHTTQKTYQKLNEYGINILVMDKVKNLEDIYSIINKMGLILKKEENANKLNKNLQERIIELSISDKEKEENSIKIYYMLSYGKSGDYTAGGDTFLGSIISKSGAINIANDLSGWKYSIERIITEDPDIILYSSDYIDIEQLKNDNIYKQLRAVREGQIYQIDEDILVRPGPRIWKGIVEIQSILKKYKSK